MRRSYGPSANSGSGYGKLFDRAGVEVGQHDLASGLIVAQVAGKQAGTAAAVAGRCASAAAVLMTLTVCGLFVPVLPGTRPRLELPTSATRPFVLEHHASGFIYRSTDDTPAAEALARWAMEVVPAVRGAVSGRSLR